MLYPVFKQRESNVKDVAGATLDLLVYMGSMGYQGQQEQRAEKVTEVKKDTRGIKVKMTTIS
jgi:hypothetical protein